MKKPKRTKRIDELGWPTIELTGGNVLTFAHGQYFWIGPNEGSGTILVNAPGTSPKRFVKAVLKAMSKKNKP